MIPNFVSPKNHKSLKFKSKLWKPARLGIVTLVTFWNVKLALIFLFSPESFLVSGYGMLNMGSERARGEPGSEAVRPQWAPPLHWPVSATLTLWHPERSGETSHCCWDISHLSNLISKIHHDEARKYGPRSRLLWPHEYIQLWQPSGVQREVK